RRPPNRSRPANPRSPLGETRRGGAPSPLLSSREAGSRHGGAEMRVTQPGISERRRLCRILLGLDDQPPAIMRRRQGREHLGKVDAAVARHGKDAVENGIEKARIAGANASEHVAPHILAVDMPDAASITP